MSKTYSASGPSMPDVELRFRDSPLSKDYDGGPAFPLYTDHVCIDEGMTLRDYFAAACLAGNSLGTKGMASDHIAAIAYNIADAMLKEREK